MEASPISNNGALECVLVSFDDEDSKGNAYDILARALKLKDRSEIYNENLHLDNELSMFYSTEDDIKIYRYTFDVNTDSVDGVVELEFCLNVFIQDENECWWTTLRDPDDIPLLQKLLTNKKLNISIKTDESVYEYKLSMVTEGLNAIIGDQQEKLESLLSLFVEDRFTPQSVDWTSIPKLPQGWVLNHILREWINTEQIDYKQYGFVLWMLSGRSEEIWQHLSDEDSILANTMRNNLLKLLNCEYKDSRHVAGHPSPEYLRWQRTQERLQNELKWLKKHPEPAL